LNSDQRAPTAIAETSLDSRLDPEQRACVRALFGSKAQLAACRGGRNSRVYRVDYGGERFALKFYPGDGRGRVEREYAAVSFFAAANVPRVPRPVRLDVAHDAAVYSWLDGAAPGEPSSADIDTLSAFAAELHALRSLPTAALFGDAAEACYDRSAILAQIATRIERLAGVTGEPALEAFLRERFAPVLARESARPVPSLSAPAIARTLSPSDFGLHNALRIAGGGLAFLDFEYFGWDDPVKLVCDVCWHPGMMLRDPLRARVLERARDVYAATDAGWEARLAAAYPLIGLRWCLIVLNEFLPVLWQRRVAAGVTISAPGARRAQLRKAHDLLDRVATHADGAAHGY